jgi:hypothetical protein
MKFRTKTNFQDEAPLESSRFFRARLEFLTTQEHPMLAMLLQKGNPAMLEHLREVANRAEYAMAELLARDVPEDQAAETVMAELVTADGPKEPDGSPADAPLSQAREKQIQSFRTWLHDQSATYPTETTA